MHWTPGWADNRLVVGGGQLNALKIAAPDKQHQHAVVARMQAVLPEFDALECASIATLEGIVKLPGGMLAQAFESLGEKHG